MSEAARTSVKTCGGGSRCSSTETPAGTGRRRVPYSVKSTSLTAMAEHATHEKSCRDRWNRRSIIFPAVRFRVCAFVNERLLFDA
jgi:hypothetical protein